MSWELLTVLAVMGYAQRSIPWVLAQRITIPQNVTRWLEYVAPAAFATLFVTDVTKLTLVSVAALLSAVIVAWRTKNLGLTVLIAMFVSIGSRL